MHATLKDFLLYMGAFTKVGSGVYEGFGLDDYAVIPTEGAEQGMVTIHAAKALEIASTTCNRAIYCLVEAPSYGYTTSRIQELVNGFKDSFLKAGGVLRTSTRSTLNLLLLFRASV